MWNRILHNANGEALKQEHIQKRRLATLIALFIVPFLILFAAKDLAIGHSAVAIFCGLFAFVMLTCIACIHLSREKIKPAWMFRISLLFSLILFLYFVYESSHRPQYLFWIYLFPLAGFFLLGKREGLLWVASLVILASLILFLPIETVTQSIGYRLRFLGSLFIVSAITYAYESIREKSQQTLHAHYIRLRDAREDSHRAKQAKNVFLANMNHEFRTPLNHIIGFTELMMNESMGQLNEKQTESLQNILKSSKHLLVLINDILEYTNVETGKLSFRPDTVEIRALLKNCVSSINTIAANHNIEVSLNADGIPERITGDRYILKQVMYNLLSNALAFTPTNGSIEVQAISVHTMENNNTTSAGTQLSPPGTESDSDERIKIIVKDAGIGLFEGYEKTIFKPFYQGEDAVRKKHPGLGLGLALSSKLANLHGGTIEAKSDGEGKGSTFIFTFPSTQEKPYREHGIL